MGDYNGGTNLRFILKWGLKWTFKMRIKYEWISIRNMRCKRLMIYMANYTLVDVPTEEIMCCTLWS